MNEKELAAALQIEHPDRSVKLLNGSVIRGYFGTGEPWHANNTLQLDTTGRYLTLGRKRKLKAQKENEQQRIEIDFFWEHAHYFWAHRDRIYSDSRLFLAPVANNNHLAYTGRSGFYNITLGVYLEFWEHYAPIADLTNNGDLLVQLAGSPLSGANECTILHQNGEHENICVTSFHDMFSTFMAINRRYDECKSKYAAYDLRQAYSVLLKADEKQKTLTQHAKDDVTKLSKK